MKKLKIVCALLLIVVAAGAVRLCYLQGFYNISMEQANIQAKIATECKFTMNTYHCYELSNQFADSVGKWATFNKFWHRWN
ncbi:TPA: hypothetical protein NQS24_002241 [Klebsiella pneumoniae]|nr:hypothetical protein [Klebsiella pneumoniae]HDH0755984.1 hypothetical protein [Klebsiella pneumoniae]